MSGCNARQHSDQMICGPCALAWDVNDPEPPTCNAPPIERRVTGARRSGLTQAAENYKRERFERLAVKEGYSLRRGVDGSYASERTRGAFWGFCAALELP